MTDLPMGWTWATLGDLAAPDPGAITDGPFGSNLKSAHYTNSGARVIRLQNIGDGEFRDDRSYVSLEHFESLRKHEIRAGDLALASLGDSPPRACIVPRLAEPAIVKADCIRIRLHPEVLNHWVLSALRAPQTRNRVRGLIKGVGRPRLGLGQIRTIPIPLPPLAEQHRITHAVEERLSSLSRGVKLLRDTQKRVLDHDAAVLFTAIRRTHNSLCDSVKLGAIARVGSGATPLKSNSAYYEGGAIPWVTSGDLTGGQVREVKGRVTTKALRETALKLWPKGSLVIAMYGEGKTRGTVAELQIEAVTNQACAVIDLAPENRHLAPWIRTVLESRYQEMRELAAGGVQPNLSLGLIKNFEIPLPREGDRESILEQISAARSMEMRMSAAISRAVTQAESLERSILRAAFGGELADQDPSEEPGDFLLARIHAEREAATAAAKKTRKPRTRKAPTA